MQVHELRYLLLYALELPVNEDFTCSAFPLLIYESRFPDSFYNGVQYTIQRLACAKLFICEIMKRNRILLRYMASAPMITFFIIGAKKFDPRVSVYLEVLLEPFMFINKVSFIV